MPETILNPALGLPDVYKRIKQISETHTGRPRVKNHHAHQSSKLYVCRFCPIDCHILPHKGWYLIHNRHLVNAIKRGNLKEPAKQNPTEEKNNSQELQPRAASLSLMLWIIIMRNTHAHIRTKEIMRTWGTCLQSYYSRAKAGGLL